MFKVNTTGAHNFTIRCEITDWKRIVDMNYFTAVAMLYIEPKHQTSHQQVPQQKQMTHLRLKCSLRR